VTIEGGVVLVQKPLILVTTGRSPGGPGDVAASHWIAGTSPGNDDKGGFSARYERRRVLDPGVAIGVLVEVPYRTTLRPSLISA
jgi:hypothetical protein